MGTIDPFRGAGHASAVCGVWVGMNFSTIGRVAALAVALMAPAGAAQADTKDVAYDEMRACAQLGAKPPGSGAGREQARRIERAFREAGFATTREDFHVPLFQEERTRLTVAGKAIPAESFAYGGTGRVEAAVVDVGVGRPADYAGKDVTGKIVMVNRDEAFHRSSQLAQVIARGGAAMLYVSGSPDNLIQEGAVRFAQLAPAPIPTVSVGAQDGAAVRAALAAGAADVTLEVQASREDAVARNVIGVRRGTTHPGKVIVVGAHYDSWHAGAIDNCTAVGSLLSIADAVEDVPLAYTVVLAGWDAEEVGLTGSYDWVARHADRLGDIVANVNLEMTAAEAGAPALRFGTGGAKLTELVRQAAAANGYVATELPATVVRAISGGILPTDIQPFYSAGIQGFSTFTSTPYYHTPQDVPEHVDPASLRRVSAYLRDALLALQTAAPAGARRARGPEPHRAGSGAGGGRRGDPGRDRAARPGRRTGHRRARAHPGQPERPLGPARGERRPNSAAGATATRSRPARPTRARRRSPPPRTRRRSWPRGTRRSSSAAACSPGARRRVTTRAGSSSRRPSASSRRASAPGACT